MKVKIFILISLFASLIMACSQKTKTESGKTEVKEVNFYDIEDDVPPPPPVFTSNFKTLQDWLFSICDGKKPNKSITNYEFGLFESPDDYTIFLVGINRHNKGDTSYTRIEFEPSHYVFSTSKKRTQKFEPGAIAG